MMATGNEFEEVAQVGIFSPKMQPSEELSSGEVGYVIAGIKSVTDTRIGIR